LRRLGDNGQLVLLQFIGADESSKKHDKTSTKKRSRKKPAKSTETGQTTETGDQTDQ
jgi:hypothetical protein